MEKRLELSASGVAGFERSIVFVGLDWIGLDWRAIAKESHVRKSREEYK